MTPDCEHKLQSLVERMEKWQVGSEIDTATLDLDFHRTIWNQSGNSYLENALLTLVPFQFAHHALKIISHDAPRWPLAHHRVLFDVVLGKSKVTPEEAMLAHLKLSYPTPERFSSLAL
jgi:DNA-binding FadR family transcriptional regulator